MISHNISKYQLGALVREQVRFRGNFVVRASYHSIFLKGIQNIERKRVFIFQHVNCINVGWVGR